MPIFKPTDLTDARAVTFSAKDLNDATPANSMEDMTRTSTLTPAQAARAHLASRGLTPEQIKAHPPAPTEYEGPFGNYGFNTKLSGPGFFDWEAAKKNLNPMNALDSSLAAASNFIPQGAAPGMQHDPKDINLPNFSRDMGAITQVPTPTTFSDTYKESYRRGEAGQSTADMYQAPVAMGATLGTVKGIGAAAKAFPESTSSNLINRWLGKGAIDTDLNKNAGRGISKAKIVASTADGVHSGVKEAINQRQIQLKQMMNTPLANAPAIDGNILLKEAFDSPPLNMPRTALKGWNEMRANIATKMQEMTGGSGQLTPVQADALKNEIDVNFGRLSADATELNLNQKSGSVRRLFDHAVDKTVPGYKELNDHLADLHQADKVLITKIKENSEAPPFSLNPKALVRGALTEAVSPGGSGGTHPGLLTTPGRTALAAILSQPPNIPRSLGGMVANPSVPTEGNFNTPTQPPPAGGFTGGTKYNTPNLKMPVGAGPSEVIPTEGGTPTPPTSPEPPPTIPVRAKTEAKVAALTKSPADVRPDIAAANRAHNTNAIKYLNDKYPLNGTENTPKVFKPTATTEPQIPAKPTHVQEGTQVSGIDDQGNLISGNLEKLYPVVGADGQPTWKGTVLDLRNSRTMDLPADRLFDRLSGPPKSAVPPKPRTAATAPPPAPVAAPKTKLDTLLDQFDDEIPEAQDPKQAELERAVAPKAVPATNKKTITAPPLDKGEAAKKAIQDWLDKKALADMEEQLGAGKRKRSGRPPGTSGAKMSDGPDPRDIAKTLLDAERRRATQDVYSKHVSPLDDVDASVGERYKIDKYFDASASSEEQAKGQEIYNGFRQYRKMLKQRYGDTIKLVRLDPADEPRLPNKTVLHWWEPGTADEKAWSQDSNLGKRPRLEQDIPIDDIVAAPDFGKGKRQEFLVINRASKYLLDPVKKINGK